MLKYCIYKLNLEQDKKNPSVLFVCLTSFSPSITQSDKLHNTDGDGEKASTEQNEN